MKLNIRYNRNLLINIGISLLSIILLFVCLEIGIRLSFFINAKNNFYRAMNTLPKLYPGKEATLGEIIQPSKHENLIYELRRNLDVIFIGVELRTNRFGFREKEIIPEKPKGVIRIVMLGDSYMFGWGLPPEGSIGMILEDRLNHVYPQKKWEIINTAVPGYNTAMEVESLEKKSIQFQPDIVIMEITGNDINLPNFILNEDKGLDFKKSYFVDFIIKKQLIMESQCRLFYSPRNPKVPECFESDPEKVPAKYRSLVGLSGFEAALKKLASLSKQYKFKAVAFISYPYNISDRFLLCQRNGIPVFFDYFNIDDKTLILSQQDAHTSAKQNAKTAENILNFISSQGIVDKLLITK